MKDKALMILTVALLYLGGVLATHPEWWMFLTAAVSTTAGGLLLGTNWSFRSPNRPHVDK